LSINIEKQKLSTAKISSFKKRIFLPNYFTTVCLSKK
jgi:hypothetical protein